MFLTAFSLHDAAEGIAPAPAPQLPEAREKAPPQAAQERSKSLTPFRLVARSSKPAMRHLYGPVAVYHARRDDDVQRRG